MLNKLRIQNFKGWKDTGTIRMAPITLLFGTNSSGKSSIGQFLMMLKQTVESQDRKAVFNPGGKNCSVQLGSFREMVHQRDLSNSIHFEYGWDALKAIKFRDSVSLKNYSAKSLYFSAVVGNSIKSPNSLAVRKFNYNLTNKNDEKWSIGMSSILGKSSLYNVKTKEYSLVRNPGRMWYPNHPVRFYGFPDEVASYYKNAEFVQQLNLAQELLFNSISYLGPLRTKVDRIYSWAGLPPESVGNSGENAIAAILSAKERRISPGYNKKSKPLEQIVASSLKMMGLIEEFRVRKISKHRQEYEVNVKTKGSKDWVDLPDVGFGISQVLPVLVQCYYAPANSIIIMEQPEVHLHPSAQAVLADVMISVINSRENGENRNIQLLIETHSEHFLRRLQRRIADDSLSEERLSVYFSKVDRSPAKLEPLQIDRFGNIKNWPENFFGDEMADITGQAQAAMEKRMKLIDQGKV